MTMEKRNQYMMGENRGLDCSKSRDGLGLFGQTAEYYYTPNSKPTKHYITWKQFWKARGY